ncbi:hypothetical protein CLIB1423_16S03158 [[Candida] railenensis]|uniref:Uncharacterized protein n=1 Tax=[Candida] railenensis TaxID=45579 RepID=A0A9P0QT53_9ASCO|nr:hypothetical protein CLIB1423_16S03158 [[Candida] railenensis]
MSANTNEQSSARTGSGGSRGSRRNRPSTKNDDRKSNPRGKTSRRKPRAKAREVKNDYRFLEIVKLIKFYKPVTINGVSINSITEKAEKEKAETAAAPEKKDLEEGETETETETEPETETESKTGKSPQSTTFDDPVHRFIGKCITEGTAIYISMMFPPADPDFPYDLDILKISLCVPAKYPYDSSISPSIYVLNDDIPRGFAVNIEIGFREITAMAQGKASPGISEEEITLAKGRGLLSQIQTLDRNLEFFLKKERKETVKFVKGSNKKSKNPSGSSPAPSPTPPPNLTPTPTPSPAPSHALSNSTANPLRQQYLESLTSKIPSKLFTKNDRENVYRIELPVNASSISTPKSWSQKESIDVRLHVPASYPEDKAWISIPAQMLNKITTARPNAGESYTPGQLERFAKDAALERQELARAAKSLEKNFKRIPDFIKSTSSDLVGLLNFAANYTGLLCQNEIEFREMITLLKS